MTVASKFAEHNYLEINRIVESALVEDIGDGDHSTLACIDSNAIGTAQLLVKEEGIIAGVELAQFIIKKLDPEANVKFYKKDGDKVTLGDLVFIIDAKIHAILSAERLILNCMQRMSGIASQTNRLVKCVEKYGVKLLDTRKTTPGLRLLEKWAVTIGGGFNHRFALYDMIMLKDNHVDFCGGIEKAIHATHIYLNSNNKSLKIEIEVRSIEELNEVLNCGGVDRIMLDNFSPNQIAEAIKLIPNNYETEASGGITENNIEEYAKTGIQFISVGALTHSVKSLDLSLKAKLEN
jgi:nicotinate-nucleotide pyrophosphorylase (carboxylating)